MTSKLIVNNIEADAGVSTITFGSEISASTFTGNLTGNVTGNVTSSSTSTFSSGLNVTGGSVGIGTDNPTTPLHLFGTSDILLKVESTDQYAHIELGDNSSTARITNDGATGTLRLRADKDNAVSSSNIQFEIDGSEKVRINSNGDVGINTTIIQTKLDVFEPTGTNSSRALVRFQKDHTQTSVTGSTGARDQYPHALILENKDNSADTGTVSLSFSKFSSGVQSQAIIAGIQESAGNMALTLNTESGNSMGERLRITSSGNVGIGLTNPSTKLDLYRAGSGVAGRFGKETIWGEFQVDGQRIGIQGTRSSDNAITGFFVENPSSTGTSNFESATIKVINTERVRVASNGYFRATRTGSYVFPANNFHSFDNDWAGNEVLLLTHTTTSTSIYGLQIRYQNSTPNNTAYFLNCRDSSATRFEVRNNGGLANYQSNDVNLCDEREKKNIEALDSTWDCLKNWELKKFHYNEDADTDDKRYGVIAQQVAPHCPEVITEWVKQKAEDAVLDEDGNVVTPAKEEITRMGVKEQQMMWMAIKALQEAQTRIETLEAEVAALKAG